MTFRACAAVFVLLALLAIGGQAAARAGTVGLTRRETTLPSASDRRSDHRSLMAVTIWYPAADGAKTMRVDIGPPGRALLVGGRFAVDARPRAGAHPVILLSHGFGGGAEDLSWLAGGLAARGYVVIGVDHPGNNALDRTPVGGTAGGSDRATWSPPPAPSPPIRCWDRISTWTASPPPVSPWVG
jgi:predicted dienelactone hydrolase